MTAPVTFKQTDLTRAIKGAVKAGLNVGRVEIDRNGKIAVYPKDGESTGAASDIDKMLGIK